MYGHLTRTCIWWCFFVFCYSAVPSIGYNTSYDGCQWTYGYFNIREYWSL